MSISAGFGGLIHEHEASRELRVGLEFDPPDPEGPVPPGLSRFIELEFTGADAAGPRQIGATIGFGHDVRLPFTCTDVELPDADASDERLFEYKESPEA